MTTARWLYSHGPRREVGEVLPGSADHTVEWNGRAKCRRHCSADLIYIGGRETIHPARRDQDWRPADT